MADDFDAEWDDDPGDTDPATGLPVYEYGDAEFRQMLAEEIGALARRPPLSKAAPVLKIGPLGGQIVGYAHGDTKRPIYAGKNPHLTHAQVYPSGSGAHGQPADVPVHDAHGPYAWTDHPSIAGGKPAVVHLPTGRTVKTVEPKPGAKGPKATASAAVKDLGAAHGQRGLDAHPGGFVAKVDYAAMRSVVEKHEGAAQHPATAPTPAAVATKAEAPAPGMPIDAAGAKHLVGQIAAATGLSQEKIHAALAAPDASAASPEVALHRSAIEGALLKKGLGRPDAILEYLDAHHQAGDVDARLAKIGIGDQAVLRKEYGQTPLYDLQVTGKVTLSKKPVHGLAVCTWTRELVMGPSPDGTYTTGNYRHELGHAVRLAWAKKGHDASDPMSRVVVQTFKQAHERAKANPAGLKKTLPHEWYEVNYGVIGTRDLDNFEETAAEHYRAYHREVLRHKFKGGQNLVTYRERHPEMAKLWDARYTAAILASFARKGLL